MALLSTTRPKGAEDFNYFLKLAVLLANGSIIKDKKDAIATLFDGIVKNEQAARLFLGGPEYYVLLKIRDPENGNTPAHIIAFCHPKLAVQMFNLVPDIQFIENKQGLTPFKVHLQEHIRPLLLALSDEIRNE